ncbi:MAG: C40 family peptidase [Proteobacteria bacterium]|nr:C40 family peptidase [Pseudomonadota bacterium]
MNQVTVLSDTNPVQRLLQNPKIKLVTSLMVGLILFLSLNGTAFARETHPRGKKPTLSEEQSIVDKLQKKSANKRSKKKSADKRSPKKSSGKKSGKKSGDKKSNKYLADKRSDKKRPPQKKHRNRSQVFDQTLQAEIKKYLGVPYRYGGNTTKGMDCSGFVKRIYSETFSTDLPHQASQQFFSPKLEKISSKNLQTGDLVFFSAPKRKRINHVGIYLSNNKFIHAIRKKGITVSSLNSNCWQSQIVGAKRLRGIELKDASTHVPPVKMDLTFVENHQIRLQFDQTPRGYVN